MSNLQHIKGSRTRVLNTFPTKTFGKDGDIVISRINGKGVFLCSKAGGMWYAANKMQELNKLEKTSIRELTTNKLTINKMINTERSVDRFVVNDGGSIKYRTGEQVVGDLPLPFDNIAYKTAYCSLEQYPDKDSCESNGGTWYYSENDSHDSISSTAENQLLTVGQSIGSVDAEPTLTYDGSVFQIKNNLNYDDNWQSSVQESQIRFHDGTYHTGFKTHGTMTADCLYTLPAAYPGANKVLQSDTSGNLTWVSDVGAITALNNATANELVTVGATTTELDAEANLTFDGNHLSIAATGKIYFDGGTHTYIYEQSDDILRIAVGGDVMMQLSEKGDDGNEVNFGSSCVGFTQLEPTYNISTTTVDFRHSNKHFLTFGAGSITNLQLFFPLVSGNFQLLIKQDGTGSRTITNYKVYEFDESAADGSNAAVFAGGSNPTLTTDANHVDILSFYWDADNEIAYGVATLDFQF